MCPTTAGNAAVAREISRKPDLRPAFDVLDVDRDGKISPDDLRSFYGHYNSFETAVFSSSSEEENEIEEEKDGVISSMISMADENRDGFVEYEEFEKVLLGNSKESTRRKMGNNNNNNYRYYLMENVFRLMDKDGDGKVGYEDLKSYLSSAGFNDATNDEDVKAMIRLAAGGGPGAGAGEGYGVTFEALLKVLFL